MVKEKRGRTIELFLHSQLDLWGANERLGASLGVLVNTRTVNEDGKRTDGKIQQC